MSNPQAQVRGTRRTPGIPRRRAGSGGPVAPARPAAPHSGRSSASRRTRYIPRLGLVRVSGAEKLSGGQAVVTRPPRSPARWRALCSTAPAPAACRPRQDALHFSPFRRIASTVTPCGASASKCPLPCGHGLRRRHRIYWKACGLRHERRVDGDVAAKQLARLSVRSTMPECRRPSPWDGRA